MNTKTLTAISFCFVMALAIQGSAHAQSSQCQYATPIAYDFESNYNSNISPLQYLATRKARTCSSPILIELHRNLHTRSSAISYRSGHPAINTRVKNPTTAAIATVNSTGNNISYYRQTIISSGKSLLSSAYPTPLAEEAPNTPTFFYDGQLSSETTGGLNKAFPNQQKKQVQIVEIDPKQTLDGYWIASHDYFLNREFYGKNNLGTYTNPNSCPSGQQNFIPCLTLAQIESYQLAVWDVSQGSYPAYSPSYASHQSLLSPPRYLTPQYQAEINTYFTNVGLLGSLQSSTPSAQLHIRSVDDILNFTLYVMGQSNYNSNFFKNAWYSIHITDLCKSIAKNSSVYFSGTQAIDAAQVGANSLDCIAFLPAISKYVTNSIANIYAINRVPIIYVNINLFDDTDFLANPDDFSYTAADGTSNSTTPNTVTMDLPNYCSWSGYSCNSLGTPSGVVATEFGITSLNGTIDAPTTVAGLNFLGFDDSNWGADTTFKSQELALVNWARSQGFIDIRTDYFPDTYNPQLPQPWCLLPWTGLDPTNGYNLRCLSSHDLQRATNVAYMIGYQADPTGDDSTTTAVLPRPDVIITDNPVRLTDCIANISLSGCR